MTKDYLRKRYREMAAETMKINQRIVENNECVYDNCMMKVDGKRYVKAFLFDGQDMMPDGSDEDIILMGRPVYDTDYFLVDADSFEVARDMEKVLVMNFANAHRAGGGFLNGAIAQEESLCRNSTLYASLTSPEAQEMYRYNNTFYTSVDSDHMVLSPHVLVYRDCNGAFLDEPKEVAVITVPAPNKKGRAHEVAQTDMDKVMTDRIEMMVRIAIPYKYKALVLGAWGCGAFGHDPVRVAQYFREVFVGRGYGKYFQKIVFAILDDTRCLKLGAFADVFKKELIDGILFDIRGHAYAQAYNERPYVVCRYPMPVCNHTEEVSEDNLGYVQGVLLKGVPFEAELWQDRTEGTKHLTIILPEQLEEVRKKAEEPPTGVKQIPTMLRSIWNAVLPIGMFDRELEECAEDDDFYMMQMIENKIFNMTGDSLSIFLRYLTDTAGNDLVALDIMLERNGVVFATTDLSFMPFERSTPPTPSPARLHIVK